LDLDFAFGFAAFGLGEATTCAFGLGAAALGFDLDLDFDLAEALTMGDHRYTPFAAATERYIKPSLPFLTVPRHTLAGNGGLGRLVYFLVV